MTQEKRPEYIRRKVRQCCCPECTEPHERKVVAESPTESGSWDLAGIDTPPTGNYKQWALIEDAPRVIVDWGCERTYPRRIPISPVEYLLDWGEIRDGVLVDLPDSVTHDFKATLGYVCECYPLGSCKNWGTCGGGDDDPEPDYCMIYPAIVPPGGYDKKYKNFKYWAVLDGGYPMGSMIASGTIADDGTLSGLPAVDPAHGVHVACCPIEVCRPSGSSAIVLGTNIGQSGTVVDLKPYKYVNGVDGDYVKYAPGLYCYLHIRDFDPQIKRFGDNYCAGNYAYQIGIGMTDKDGYLTDMADEYDMGHNSVAVITLSCHWSSGCIAPIPDEIPDIPYAVIGYGSGAEVADLLLTPGLAPPGTHVSIYQSSGVCCMDPETGRTQCVDSGGAISLPLLYSDQTGVLRDSDCNIPDLSALASADPCLRFAVTNYSEICRDRNSNSINNYDPGCGGALRSRRTTSGPFTGEVVRLDVLYDVTFIRSWRTGTSITFEWEMNLPDIKPYIDRIPDRIPGTQVTFTDGQNFEYGRPTYCGVSPWRSGVPPQLAIINSNNRYVDDGYWCDPTSCGDEVTAYRLVNSRDNVISWFTEYACPDPPDDPAREGVVPFRYMKWRDDIEVYV